MDQVTEIISQYPLLVVIFSVIGMLPVLASVYVSLTPSPDDDKWLSSLYEKPIIGKILTLLVSFSPIEKKKGKLVVSNKGEKEEA